MFSKKAEVDMLRFFSQGLLALVMFGTVFYVGSNALTGSNQAEENFHKFGFFIQEFAKDNNNKGKSDGFLIIQDVGDIIASFPKGIDTLQIVDDKDKTVASFSVLNDVCKGNACICMCKNYDPKNKVKNKQTPCENRLCYKLGESITTNVWYSARMVSLDLRRVRINFDYKSNQFTFKGGHGFTVVQKQDANDAYDGPGGYPG